MSDLLNGLNTAQYQAVTSQSSVILTLAGAGSGKTTVLTRRIANLNQNHRVGTSSMLALTFTRLAGKEMKERVIKLVGEDEGKKLFCNTFHAFAVQILKQWGHRLGIDKDFSIYEQSDREEIMQRIIEEFGNRTTLKKVLTRFESCKDFQEERQHHPEESRVLEEYGYRLRQNNAVDLDRLIDLVNLLWYENQDALAYYQNQYSHVFVDEFQDTSDEQMEMIRLLNPRNLFVVGDDFQAIYGWRKARVEYILTFHERYPNCEVIKLEDNYRSTKQIVEPANRLIKWNTQQTDKTAIAHSDGEDIHITAFPDEAVETTAIVSFAEAFIQDGLSPKNIAILSRTNQQLHQIIEAFEKTEVPAQRIANDDDVFKKQDIKLLLAWMNILLNTHDSVNLKRAIKFPRRFVEERALQYMELEALRNDVTLFDVLVGKENEFMSVFQKIQSGINELKVHSPTRYLLVIDQELGIQESYIQQGLLNRVQDVQQALYRMENWEKTQRSLGESHSPTSFLQWLRTKDIQEKLLEDKDAVKLMTVHASKGLEFDTVIVAGMNQGTFPSRRSADFEEERRLFYVAVTRAKNRLILTRAEHIKQPWNKGLVETQPSQFISELVGVSNNA